MTERHLRAMTPPPQGEERQREFEFEHGDFLALRALIKRETGIHLTDSKKELVYGRVSRRLRVLGVRSFAEYRELLDSDGEGELRELCNAMTTNLTAFFRESHHFDYLRDHLLEPRAAAHSAAPATARATDPRRIRIWSAGCSSGEEPYSIAMALCEAIPDFRRWDIKILATDIDSDMLATARQGIYPEERVKRLGAPRLARFFQELCGEERGYYQVSAELAGLITFKRLNLLHPLPMKGPLDAIFCRNVVIYFDRETQRDLFARIAPLQRANDLLFLGHSESLFKVCEDYSLVGKTVYRRA